MSVSNNTILLDGCIREYIDLNELEQTEDEIFELFSLSLIAQKMELSFEELSNAIVDGGKDGGIDTFLIGADDKIFQSEDDVDTFSFSSTTNIKVFIGQSKYKTSFVEVGLDKIITSLPLIYNLGLTEEKLLERFNTRLTEKIKIFQMSWEKAVIKNSKIEIFFYYATRANEKNIKGTFEDKVSQIKEFTHSSIHNASVNFEAFSANELLRLFRTPRVTSFELTLKETPSPIEYGGGKLGYIGVSKLKDFDTFITDEDHQLRESIFENNIRHFQGNVDVNKKIQQSINEEFDRDFWWLNNGVTIIASSVRPLGKRLILENPQIVNGLQTSFTLFHTYSQKEDDDRSLLVKIIESTDKETIDKIISSTNSQNPVSPMLLRATEEFQRNLELYFLTKGYFYDRRKNYYKNMKKPASKIFSIQSTAQAFEAIMKWSPSTARSNPTTLTKTDTSYNEIFNSQTDFGIYLNCCLIVQLSHKYINQHLDNDIKNIVRNFTYHIARIVAAIVTHKAYYQSPDILKIDISTIDLITLTQSVKLFSDTLSAYQAQNADKNIINISKAKGFSEFLNESLVQYFVVDHRLIPEIILS